MSVNTLWVWLFCQTFYGLKLSSESSLWSLPCCISSATPSPLSFVLNELHSSALVIWRMTNMYLMTVHRFQTSGKQIRRVKFFNLHQYFSPEHSIVLQYKHLSYLSICFAWVTVATHLIYWHAPLPPTRQPRLIGENSYRLLFKLPLLHLSSLRKKGTW